MENNRDKSNSNIRNKIFPVSMGLLWGITFGSAMNNWTVGLCMGFLWAIVFGLYDDEEQNDQEDKQ